MKQVLLFCCLSICSAIYGQTGKLFTEINLPGKDVSGSQEWPRNNKPDSFSAITLKSSVAYTYADTGITKMKKPLRIWIYKKSNEMIAGLLTGGSDSVLVIYEGSSSGYKSGDSTHFITIGYHDINLIKTKKGGGLLKGVLIGGGIGLLPVVFGQGGAIVAVFSFPVGIITGAIVGATAKKKFKINGDGSAFAAFVHKYVK